MANHRSHLLKVAAGPKSVLIRALSQYSSTIVFSPTPKNRAKIGSRFRFAVPASGWVGLFVSLGRSLCRVSVEYLVHRLSVASAPI